MLYTFKQIEHLRNGKFVFRDEVSEEELVATLAHFDAMKPFADLCCAYSSGTTRGFEVFFSSEDLRFARYKAILSRSLCYPSLYVEVVFPTILKCILYDDGVLFNVAVTFIKKMLPTRYFRKKETTNNKRSTLIKKEYVVQGLRKIFKKILSFLGKNLSKWKDNPSSILKPITTFFEVSYKDQSVEDFVNVHESWIPYAKRLKKDVVVGQKCKMAGGDIKRLLHIIINNNNFEAFTNAFLVKNYLPNHTSTSKTSPWTVYELGMNFRQPKFSSKKRKRSSTNNNVFDIENHYMCFSGVEANRRTVSGKSATGIGLLHLLDYLFLSRNPKEKYTKVMYQTKMFGCMEKLIYQNRLKDVKLLIPCSNECGFVTEDCSFPTVDDKGNYKKNKFKLNL